ncbi:MAG TPA: hypothetical protein VF158_14675 [Longimicrobiales bacterium]
MDAERQESTPLACVMDAIPAKERAAHVALIAHLFQEVAQEIQELPEGYAFRFPAGELESVAAFLANERKCCPFLTFELTIPPAEGPVWLRMSGPPGTRDFLAAEFRM